MGLAILRSLALLLIAGGHGLVLHALAQPVLTGNPVVVPAGESTTTTQQNPFFATGNNNNNDSLPLNPLYLGAASTTIPPLPNSAAGDGIAQAESTAARVPLPKDKIIAVIGAGMSGFAAARTLSSNGYTVIVLEARNRVGGRVNTAQPAGWDAKIELGAGWIHGVSPNNPLIPLASSVGAKVTNVRDTGSMFNSVGAELSDAMQNTAEAQVKAALKAASAAANSLETDASLDALVKQWVAKQPAFTAAARQAFLSDLDSTVVQEYADDLTRLSGQYWDEDEEFNGGDGILAGGYDQLFKGFTTLPRVSVRLNTAVRNIAYTCGGKVTITTTANQNVIVDRVIVTVPLGVLKARAVTFQPTLQNNYWAAIDRLGFGTLNKVVLRFPRVFWDNSYDWLTTWATAPSGAIQNAEFYNMFPYIGKPVLVFFAAGSVARANEALTDAQQVNMAVAQLRRMYPRASIQDTTPIATAVTRWSRDLLARGSYSYYAVGSTPDDRATLRKSVCQAVFFAGEHTHAKYFATVHGAWMSGVDAATRAMSV